MKAISKLIVIVIGLPLTLSIVGCATGSVSNYNEILPSTNTAQQMDLNADIQVEGQQIFRKNRINLDLNSIQTKSLKYVLSAQNESDSSPSYLLKTQINDFKWTVKNSGFITQKAVVSFELQMTLYLDGNEISSKSVYAKKYSATNSEFKQWSDLYLHPVFTM